MFGFVLLFSYLVSKLFYQEYVISVWCFFSAILSVLVLIIIRQLRKDDAVALNVESVG